MRCAAILTAWATPFFWSQWLCCESCGVRLASGRNLDWARRMARGELMKS